MLGSIIFRLDVFSNSAIKYNYYLLHNFDFEETKKLFCNNETIFNLMKNLFDGYLNMSYYLNYSEKEFEALNYLYKNYENFENNSKLNNYEKNISNLFNYYYDILYNLDNLDFKYIYSTYNMNSYINELEQYTDANNENTYQNSFNNFYNIWKFNCSLKKYPINNKLSVLEGIENKECYYISDFNKINLSNYQKCSIKNDKYENLLQISELYLSRFYEISINLNSQFNEIFDFLNHYNNTIHEYLIIFSNISYSIKSIFNESIGESNNTLNLMYFSFFNRDIDFIEYIINYKFKNKRFGIILIVFSFILFIFNIFSLIAIHKFKKKENKNVLQTMSTNTDISSNENNNQINNDYDKVTIDQSGIINVTDFIKEDDINKI